MGNGRQTASVSTSPAITNTVPPSLGITRPRSLIQRVKHANNNGEKPAADSLAAQTFDKGDQIVHIALGEYELLHRPMRLA